jgi:hypothetical protein
MATTVSITRSRERRARSGVARRGACMATLACVVALGACSADIGGRAPPVTRDDAASRPGGDAATSEHDGGAAAPSTPDAAAMPAARDASATDAFVAPIERGTWTRLDSGGGPFGAYFYRSVVISGGDIWMGWGDPATGPSWGNFVFDAAAAAWRRTNDVSRDPAKNIGARENYGACYDPDRDAVWIGDGAPVAYGFPEGPQSGDMRYDVATDTFTLAYPNYGDRRSSIGKGDGALVYHDDVLYSFGAWSVGPGQSLSTHDLVTEEITRGIAVESTPPWTQPRARLVYARSGIDSRTGVLWTLADDAELYHFDPSGASPTWSHVPTTGERPATVAIGAALHEAANVIVAYVGLDGVVGDDFGEDLGDTFILDLDTRVWRHGPRLSRGDAVPPRRSLASAAMSYDAANERVVITVVAGAGTEVWAFTPAEDP